MEDIECLYFSDFKNGYIDITYNSSDLQKIEVKKKLVETFVSTGTAVAVTGSANSLPDLSL
ncbi:hypothetical protein Avbf_05480 [Armadillidium vulgare]|nr:hypothetical protein Avbf_05480 [Armadillidium vulgare]